MKSYVMCKGKKITKSVLINLQKKFKKDRVIGEHLGGVTRQYIQQCRLYFGIGVSRNYYELSKAIKKDFFKNNKNAKDIAKKYKLSISQIYRYINR